jgi:23S rRNA (cytosine1962-C5)-methyltransferase
VIEGIKQFAATQSTDFNIVERSDVEARRIEGLTKREVEVHHGKVEDLVPFLEDGVTFLADVLKGQKTGFFLDQRPARLAVKRLAKDRRVMNLFSYTGAFGIHALKGGAKFVHHVDASQTALETAEKTTALNGFDANDESTSAFMETDIFPMLEAAELPGGPYDLLICDPPALTKDSSHVEQALKAYTFLNTSCLRHLPVGGILVTSSCSGRVSPEDFRSMLRIAAGRAGKQVRLIQWIGHDVDHAELLSFPEGRYLKTVIVQVTGTVQM